jgi:hypothetical protein
MSKKLIDSQSGGAELPFFAHLLTGQNQSTAATGTGTPAPTYHCLDMECTKKYPSDADEPTSTTWDK